MFGNIGIENFDGLFSIPFQDVKPIANSKEELNIIHFVMKKKLFFCNLWKLQKALILKPI